VQSILFFFNNSKKGRFGVNSKHLSRRDFLRLSGIGAAALLGNPFRQRTFPFNAARIKAQMEPFVADAEISLTATEKIVPILSGAQTHVWSYEGQLLSGSGVTVQSIPGSYLGPILRAQKGKKLRIFFYNNLAEDSVIHPHGLRVPEDCDGQPMQAIGPGETKVYEFQVIDRAGPYWFHPHPMGRTAEQVVMGMAGLFNVWDDEEAIAILGASTGANDVPVVIQDRNFDSNNQFLYNPNMLWGYLGNRILVNGQSNAAFSLEPRAYRLRFLNGSNARTYKLAWSNNMPLKVIGTDGGLLPAAISKSYVMLMPGERVDVWADFSQLAGRQTILKSLAFDPGGMGGMGGGGMGGSGMGGGSMGGGMGSSLANGAAFNILAVNIGRKATVKPILGPLPALTMKYDSSNVSNFATPVPFTLAMQQMMTWTINGRVYDPMAVADDEMVYRDVPIAWEWINNSPIPHPMHIHNVMFQVIQRNAASTPSGYSTVNQGFLDTGWKDTVIVWPGERVKIAMMFGPHMGMYMYHCHILEHEDMTMMRNYMIMDPMMSGI
jgi:FtsP/CotA-like multicopper oxidase with cupredoxin domain